LVAAEFLYLEKNSMSNFDFNNKKFALIQNSEHGEVGTDTIFRYKQEDNFVTADYSGGTIRYGKIIGKLAGDKLSMLYQCLTNDNELRAGRATAKVTNTDKGRMKLSLDWEWLTETDIKGRSEYIEIE
jgi:hypothetical protein